MRLLRKHRAEVKIHRADPPLLQIGCSCGGFIAVGPNALTMFTSHARGKPARRVSAVGAYAPASPKPRSVPVIPADDRHGESEAGEFSPKGLARPLAPEFPRAVPGE